MPAVSKEVNDAIRELCTMVESHNIEDVGLMVDIIINHYRRYYLHKIKRLETKVQNMNRGPQ